MKRNQKVHQGKNIKRFREMLGLKQEYLADKLGANWSQKKVSELENKEIIPFDTLEKISSILDIHLNVFQTFTEESFRNIISGIQNNINTVNFNPIDKLIEIYEGKKNLYERLLKAYELLLMSEKEKTDLLKSILRK
ncbi:helix-turn-helix domain-containing protein [Sphingobacterium multivorum]|uniref:helix-turn-helix domain-containing protein n=1 Tax=Sphingobacterium multivorum TaxID=28454 RepID=UPI0028AA1A7A|nr:helix-turn-helix transcriptional regulator [Sphingobacterium multivorum]